MDTKAMTSLHARIVEILDFEFPDCSNAARSARVATRILAAVADHPEKAVGEGRADCPECPVAIERATVRASLHADGHVAQCERCMKVHRRMVGPQAVRTSNGQPKEHPDTVALRELREAIDEALPEFREKGVHADRVRAAAGALKMYREICSFDAPMGKLPTRKRAKKGKR